MRHQALDVVGDRVVKQLPGRLFRDQSQHTGSQPIDAITQTGVNALDVRLEVQDAYNKKLQSKLNGAVGGSGLTDRPGHDQHQDSGAQHKPVPNEDTQRMHAEPADQERDRPVARDKRHRGCDQ